MINSEKSSFLVVSRQKSRVSEWNEDGGGTYVASRSYRYNSLGGYAVPV